MIGLMTRVMEAARRRGRALDRSRDGAILVLVLAGFLILVLASLAMYDAGTAAQEEMQIQNAADTAAYSQSVVKARSMNMISYANTAKRMIFAYFVVHSTGMNALTVSTVVYAARCISSYGSDTESCERMGVGVGQLISEAANLIANVYSAAERAAAEIETLDDFQAYLMGITPWWGYAENLMRGTQNGASITTSWPVPEGDLPAWADQFTETVQSYDETFDTDLAGYIPEHTDRFDELPVQQREVEDYFEFVSGNGLDYCTEFGLSLEHLIPAVEHIIRSDGNDSNGISTDGQTMAIFAAGSLLSAGDCMQAFSLLQLVTGTMMDVEFVQKVMDYRVDEGGFMPDQLDENDWMQRTSNITMAYRDSQRSGASRDKYSGILGDHDESPIYESSGTWTMARSEVVFGTNEIENLLSDLPLFSGGGLPGVNFGSNALAGPIVAMRGSPNMWSPQWTARLRPVYLPDEHLGETLSGEDVGLGAVYFDTLPYLAVSRLMVGVLDDDFDVMTAVADMYFMFAATSTYTNDRLDGFEQ